MANNIQKFKNKIEAQASTVDQAGLNVQPGVSPTVPETGDIWLADGNFYGNNGTENVVLGSTGGEGTINNSFGTTRQTVLSGSSSFLYSGIESTYVPLTGNAAPSGYAASATLGNADAWKAFDGTTTTEWATSVAFTNPTSLTLQIPAAKTVFEYTVRAGITNASTDSPKTWVLEGSNNGTTWTAMDSRTNVAAWANLEARTYTITTPASYSYYRMRVTAVIGTSSNWLRISELTMNSTASGANAGCVGILADSEPVIVSFADGVTSTGPSDKIGCITDDNLTAWNTLTAGSKNYLFINRDTTTGAISYVSSIYAPTYKTGTLAPPAGAATISATPNVNGTYDQTLGSGLGGSFDIVLNPNYHTGAYTGNTGTMTVSLLSGTTVLAYFTVTQNSTGNYDATARIFLNGVQVWTTSGLPPAIINNQGGLRFSRSSTGVWSFYVENAWVYTSPSGTLTSDNVTTLRVETSALNVSNGFASTAYIESGTYSGDSITSPELFNYNPATGTAKIWNGSNWEKVNRVLVGEAEVTSGGAVLSSTTYAIAGQYIPGRITATASTATTLTHNIGTDLVTAICFEATTVGGSLRPVALTGLTNKTATLTTGASVVEVQPIFRRAF